MIYFMIFKIKIYHKITKSLNRCTPRFADGREVAIKRAKHQDGKWWRRRVDSECPFWSLLRLLSRVNHRNLVQRLGFCKQRGESFWSWEVRLRVALDARGARRGVPTSVRVVPAIIHRDIKPSNLTSLR
jgi:serine/threonine protein kinase